MILEAIIVGCMAGGVAAVAHAFASSDSCTPERHRSRTSPSYFTENNIIERTPATIAPMQPYRAPAVQDRLWAQEHYDRHQPTVRRRGAQRYATAYCTPDRYASMTSEKPDAWQGWNGELPDDEPMQQPRREVRYAQYEPEPEAVPQPARVTLKPAPVVAPPTPAPIAVPNWPARPAVVEPEAAPVVVNHTAARFGALEIRT
jgi:hypothetical protein